MEVRFISKYIKKLIIEENFKPNEIAIVSRKPDDYANLFRQYFSIEKIPCNISERFLLKSSPIVIFVLDILDLILNNFHRDKFINILQNKLIDFKNSYLNIDKYNLIECLKNFKTLRNDWIKIFEKKIEDLKTLKQNDKYLNEDNLEIYNIDREIQNYTVALEDLKKFYNFLPKIDKKINWNIDKFYNLVKEDIINKFEIKEKIEQFYLNLINHYHKKYYSTNFDFYLELEEIEKLSAALVAFISLLDELKYIYNKHNQNQKYSLVELINRLKLAVINHKYNIKEKLNYGVEITSIEQIRGLDYKVIILCGANEGIFPIPFKTDTFLGKDIPDSKQRHYRSEQILFYQLTSHNLHLEDKRTIITYFGKEEGYEVAKSHFLNHFLNITNLQIKEYNFNDDYLNLNLLFNTIEFKRNNLVKEHFGKNINLKFSNIVRLEIIDNLKEELEKIVLKDKSVSEFDTYSECSYKYLVSKFYKLYEFKELDYEFSPLEIGNLLHKILFIFF
jgi:ATP-dependent helicase/nuclease subunit B